MKTVNVGIVDYGWAATAHIAAINATPQGRVTAVCFSRPLDEPELTAKHGGPIRVYRRLDDMLADPSVRVIDITSYPSRHRDEAVAAAEAKGVKGCVCFELRFSNQFQVTRAVIDEGLLGQDGQNPVESVSNLSTKSSNEIFRPYEYDTSTVTILNFKNGAIGKTAAIVDCLSPTTSTRTWSGARGACSTTASTR